MRGLLGVTTDVGQTKNQWGNVTLCGNKDQCLPISFRPGGNRHGERGFQPLSLHFGNIWHSF